MMSLRRAENALGACFSERLVIMENQRVVALLTEHGYLCEALGGFWYQTNAPLQEGIPFPVGGETIKMVGNKVFPVARPADVQQLMEKAKE
jgi:hypothetical protein